MIDVCLVGTGGMMPLKNRWLTSCYFEYNGKSVLIDCGEGTQISLAISKCKLSKLDVLLITHCHADHISGLPGLLLSLGNYSKKTPLKIYGTGEIVNVVKNLCCICERIPFPIEIIKLPNNEISTFKYDDLEISSIPLRHSINCLGYSVTLKRKPVFNPEKAKALGIPQRLWKTLHSGQSATDENGNVFTTEMIIDEERQPIKITYITDTLPFDDIAYFAKDSDLFICEGMYGDDEMKAEMKSKKHMVFSQACELAQKAQAKELWLTHYSPALQNPQDYKKVVTGIFKNTVISADGQKITL